MDAPADHPIVQHTLRYLDAGADFNVEHRQWPGTIPSNNAYPRAIWWTYEPDKEAYRYNPTVGLAAFILRYASRDSAVYHKGLAIAREATEWLLRQEPFADKHILILFQRLAEYGKGHDIPHFDEMCARVNALATRCVCTDLTKYGVEYVDRPTDLIDGPAHPWYPLIAEAAAAECDFLIESQLPDGSWPVPWQWYNEYKDEFAVAAMWWKGHIVLKHIVYLRNFGKR